MLGALAATAMVVLIASRRPDAFLNPQFWAEDAIWYGDAYNRGPLAGLLLPWMGYLQLFPRLAAALSLGVELAHAPFVVNGLAVIAQSLPPLYVLLRFSATIEKPWLRVVAALLLVGVPNSFEVQSNPTNTQSHLALLAFLIVFADPPRRWIGRAADVSLLLLAGLTAPHCMLLLPICFFAWLRGREPRLKRIVGLLAVTSAVQLTVYATTLGVRFDTPLGASLARFLQIVGGQIFLAGSLGLGEYVSLHSRGEPVWSLVTAAAGVLGIAFVVRALLVTPSFQLRMLVLFATFVLAAALASPAIDRAPRWEALRLPNAGIRYYFLPIVAFLAVVLWSAAGEPSVWLRRMARAVLALVLLVGMPSDWRVAPREDFSFPSEAARFAAAAPGTLVKIPIPPRGWVMELRKH